jgi:para-nitrobenzyl esterase
MMEDDNIEEMCKKGAVNMFEIGNLMWCEHNAQAKDATIYCYCFNPEIPGDNAGSFHSSELWFTFETLAKCWRPFVGKHYDLARQMCNYWTNFAKRGDPNGLDADGTPMPEWRHYTKEEPFIMLFENKPGKDPDRPTALMKLMAKHYFKRLKIN